MTDAQITPISIPFPDAAGHHLILNTNGVQILLTPGEADLWASGSSTYKRPPAPSIERAGGQVTILQEYHRSELTNMFRTAGDSPILDLKLGSQQPYALEFYLLGDPFKADLGGLPITNLTIGSGLGSGLLTFSRPHPSSMALLKVESQGSQLELTQLGQAHAEQILIKGNGTTLKLDWGDQLVHHCLLDLSVTGSPTTLKVGRQVAFKLEGQAGPLDAEGAGKQFQLDPSLTLREGCYWSAAALDGASPLLTIKVPSACPLGLHLT
jgi:hypothetical protein